MPTPGTIDSHDVVIVGAGPAGSSAAIRLARLGRSVLLVDKADFPRHKLCGEFVSPECIDHLEELGVGAELACLDLPNNTRTVFYSSTGRSLRVANRWLARNSRDSIGLSRFELDRILLEQAQASGARIETSVSLVGTETATDGRIRLRFRLADGTQRDTMTPVAIDATGRGRYLARNFDAKSSLSKPGQVAFKAHVRHAQIEPGSCEIFSYPGGYGGCSAIEGGLSNLCFIVASELVRDIGNDPYMIFSSVLLKNQRAAQVLAKVTVEGEWITVPIAGYGSTDPAPAGGVFAVGDAAAFIDPFTGSGISMALQSSKLLVDALESNVDIAVMRKVYRQSHDAAFRRRLALCRRLRGLSRSPKLADIAIASLARSSAVTRSLARLTR